MKILYHHRTQGKTVEGVHIREIVKSLREAGHEVVLVSPPGVDPFAEITPEYQGKSLRLRVLSWLSGVMPQICFEIMEILYGFLAFRRLDEVVVANRIDLIYERYAFFNTAGVRAAKKHGIPLILEVNEISGIERQRKQTMKRLTKRVETWIFKRAAAIISVSSFLKKEIAGQGIEASRICVVPNAVNITDFAPDANGARVRAKYGMAGAVVLGFVGSFSVWDRLEFLLEAFSEMRETEKNLRLMLVGDGFNSGSLKRLAEEKGLGGSVIFAGRVNRGEISAFMAAMDICVIPHSNPFGSPVVLFEYMALQKPVVAPDLMPIKDVVVNGYNGIMFETGSREALKSALFKIIKDARKRERIGREARKTVLTKHLWRHNAAKICEISERFQS